MDMKAQPQHGWQRTGITEKQPANDCHQHEYFQRKRTKLSYLAAAVLLLWCFLWTYPWLSLKVTPLGRQWLGDIFAGYRHELAREDMIYDFYDITPSEKLQWHSCFDTAKCARLTVPMDYNRPLNGSKENPEVHIALLMRPGVGHNETGNYSASPLLVNPGGPGGPGAMFVLGVGSALQGIVSSDRSQDIVGFDPRGVGATTPPADCWSFPRDGGETTDEDVKTGAFNQMIWTTLGAELPLVNATEGALAQRDSRARALAKLCKRQDDMHEEDSILRHVSTPAVAQDMLSIIDAWDEWRADTGQVDHHVDDQTLDQTKSDGKAYSLETRSKLTYWGFSYGTLLGATFAAMFPQRVGRIVLDGVVDADHYVSPVWSESLIDTDRAEESFYRYCLKAGKVCAIYRKGDTEEDIKARVQGVFLDLKETPFSGVSLNGNLPFTFTHTALKYLVFTGLYSPILAFPLLALIFDALHRHDEQVILQLSYGVYPSKEPYCSSSSSSYLFPTQDAQLAIMCTDKRYPLNETVPNLEKRFESMANISSYADVWMSLMIGCDAYDITPTDPPMRWDDHPMHRQTPINTSFPLLFLSNSADPVTPLYAGVKMARKFVDAGLIEQKSEGHCSLAAVSKCTLESVRAYFEDGKVPARPKWGPNGEEIEKGEWKRCEAEEWPWKPFQGEARIRDSETKLWTATKTREGEVDVHKAMKEELRAVEMMEAWKDVQDFAETFIRPPAMPRMIYPAAWSVGRAGAGDLDNGYGCSV